jgi:hypothetical protein
MYLNYFKKANVSYVLNCNCKVEAVVIKSTFSFQRFIVLLFLGKNITHVGVVEVEVMSAQSVYLGRAPGDLPEIPNKHKETWLTEPVLVFVFMEVLPGIAAILICFLALTVIAIGVSLLCKYFCLLYSRRLQFKRLKKRKRRVGPMDANKVNKLEESSDDVSSYTQISGKVKKRKGSRELEVESEMESVKEDSDEDAEYGILTGTKRIKKDSHLQHHHHHHRHPHKEPVGKHRARHVVAKIMRRVRDGVLGKHRIKKPDSTRTDSLERHHHHSRTHDHNNHHQHEHRRRPSGKSATSEQEHTV